jgi:NADH-quinone oxidoreductase subunit G
MPVADIGQLDRALVVGSTLRKDHPLIALRLRQAAKKQLELNIINPVDDDLLMRVAGKSIVAPSMMVDALAAVVRAVAQSKNLPVPTDVPNADIDAGAKAIAASLTSGKNAAVWLGNMAQHHPAASQLHWLVQKLAELLGAKFGVLGEAANSVGGYLAGAIPRSGLNARQMFVQSRKGYILLGAEPELDAFDGAQAVAAMKAAEFVVALSAYQHHALDYAHALLPIAPFTETSGTFVSTEGRVQSFNGVVLPLAETRPAWKVLRVLGNLAGLAGFDYDSSEAVRKDALGDSDVAARLNNALSGKPQPGAGAAAVGVQRIGEVSCYQADAIVRRATALQKTRDGGQPAATLAGGLFDKLGLRDGDSVRITQGAQAVVLFAQRDEKLPADCVRVPAGHPATAGLGGLFDGVALERVAAVQKVAV